MAISRVCGLERRDAGPQLGNSGSLAADGGGLELWLLSASASAGCCDRQELLSRVPVHLTGRRVAWRSGVGLFKAVAGHQIKVGLFRTTAACHHTKAGSELGVNIVQSSGLGSGCEQQQAA